MKAYEMSNYRRPTDKSVEDMVDEYAAAFLDNYGYEPNNLQLTALKFKVMTVDKHFSQETQFTVIGVIALIISGYNLLSALF